MVADDEDSSAKTSAGNVPVQVTCAASTHMILIDLKVCFFISVDGCSAASEFGQIVENDVSDPYITAIIDPSRTVGGII